MSNIYCPKCESSKLRDFGSSTSMNPQYLYADYSSRKRNMLQCQECNFRFTFERLKNFKFAIENNISKEFALTMVL